MKIIANNKKVYHDYTVEKTYEAGIVLKGSEIKSVRMGKVSLLDSYGKINAKGEVFIVNMHISKYDNAHIVEGKYDERASRKLLLHKLEIKRIREGLQEKGYSLVPTKIYFKGNYVKIELGLVKGKKNYDKRHALKEKTQKREIDKLLKGKV